MRAEFWLVPPPRFCLHLVVGEETAPSACPADSYVNAQDYIWDDTCESFTELGFPVTVQAMRNADTAVVLLPSTNVNNGAKSRQKSSPKASEIQKIIINKHNWTLARHIALDARRIVSEIKWTASRGPQSKEENYTGLGLK